MTPIRSALAAIAAAWLLAAAYAAPAHAGTYTIHSCGSDGVNAAFSGYATSGLTAFARCPGFDYDGANTGLLTKAAAGAGGGRLAAGSSAWRVFEAPAGAALQSMSFRYSGGRANGCWAFGVFAWDGDAFHPGDHLWGYPADCSAPGGGFSYFVGPTTLDLRGHQKVRTGVRCDG